MGEKDRHVLIYGYLLARIHFGFYPAGEPLPSIYRLSEIFGVSTMTAREAIRMLEEKGYVTRSQGKRSVLTADYSGKELPDSMRVPEETLQDLYQSLNILLPGIFYHCCRYCGQREIQQLYRILDRPNQAWDEPPVQFLFHLVRQLKNPLLDNLYADTLLFSYPSHLSSLSKEKKNWKESYEKLRLELRRILDSWKDGDNAWLWERIRQAYLEFDPSYATSPPAGKRAVSYCWGKPYIVNSVAREMIFRICCGVYPAGSFLPSPGILAAGFSFSIITVRRAISLLNKLGIVESINGKGTRVLSPEIRQQKIRWEDSTVRKNAMTYLYALHILALTCRSAANAVYPQVDRKAKAKARREIVTEKEKGHADAVLAICLDMLIDFCDFEAFGNIYRQLLNLLLWGHPLSCFSSCSRLDDYAGDIGKSLESDDSQRFAKGLEQLVGVQFLSAKAKIVSAGIREAENIDLPFLPDDTTI